MPSPKDVARRLYASFHRSAASGPQISAREQAVQLLHSLITGRRPERTFMPPGHFYSPIVDAAAIKDTFPKKRPLPPLKLIDVEIDLDAMTRLWDEQLFPEIKRSPIPRLPDGVHRYHFQNSAYGLGDGSILRAMILLHRPKRIVEVGSGWSSACMLDTLDEAELDCEITFIEPNAKLLRSILRGADNKRVNILEQKVQDVPLDVFESLGENDILFIDSTHVLKTCSDVTHELTEILPRLKPGVVIHFHDIFYPFEYTYRWVVEQNRSWNEVYALRNFLAFNDRFRVIFFNDMFVQLRREAVQRDFPEMFSNSGGAIWIKRVS